MTTFSLQAAWFSRKRQDCKFNLLLNIRDQLLAPILDGFRMGSPLWRRHDPF